MGKGRGRWSREDNMRTTSAGVDPVKCRNLWVACQKNDLAQVKAMIESHKSANVNSQVLQLDLNHCSEVGGHAAQSCGEPRSRRHCHIAYVLVRSHWMSTIFSLEAVSPVRSPRSGPVCN